MELRLRPLRILGSRLVVGGSASAPVVHISDNEQSDAGCRCGYRERWGTKAWSPGLVSLTPTLTLPGGGAASGGPLAPELAPRPAPAPAPTPTPNF